MKAESSESAHNALERKKSNLAFAFFCMEKDRAKDMEIFYAFCRLMDDIADEEGVDFQTKKVALEKWKDEINLAYDSDEKLSPLGEEMRSLVKRRNIPRQYVLDIIDGVMRDTIDKPFETFEDIKHYCYGVASAVGLVSIYIFGCKSPLAKEFAESLGYALQFTNILRDVVDDIKSHGRVYIPTKELDAFGVSRDDLLNNPHSPKCKKLFAFLYFRAKHFFNKSRRLLPPEDKRAFAPALIMWAIYEEILESLKKLDFAIPEKPLKISKSRKIYLALKAIRESKKPERADKQYGNVAVLGAGVAGLGTALNLALDGFDVSLYEAKSHIGGRCASLEWNGVKLDNATHATMGCYKYFHSILDLLGTNTEEFFKPTSAMQFLFADGKSQTITFPKKNDNFIKKIFSCLKYAKLEGMKTSLLLLLKLKFGFANALKNESASAYLNRMSVSKKAIENFWEPFCVSALNTALEKTDAKLMIDTARKSILKGGNSAILNLPQRPIADSLAPALVYLEGVGARIYLGETVKSLNFVGKKIASITTNKCDMAGCKNVVSALNLASLKKLLPDNSSLKKRLEKIEETDITNIYFKTPRQLIKGDYACLIGSPLHWIFAKQSAPNAYIYGITISASSIKSNKAEADFLLKTELKKFFGDVEITDILPSTFIASTISADTQSERARPTNADCVNEFENLHIVGDWVQTDLPCTIESASKSAFDLSI